MKSSTTSKTEESNELPFDFGEFSLRTIGVTVNVPESIIQRYANLITTMFSASTNGDHVENLRSKYEKYEGANEKFIMATYNTIVVHEKRHFHDFLSTPFGSTIMQNLMLACRYIPMAINQLHREDVIAFPLPAWASLNPKLYNIYQKQFTHSIFNEHPPMSINRISESVTKILNRVQAQFSSAQQILEASALSIQIHQIEELYGYEAAISFATEVNKKDAAGTYTKMWSLFNTIASKIHEDYYFSPMVANAILLYGLCGNNKEGEETENPIYRINSVLGYLMHSKEIATEENILDILDYCSSIFNIPTISESLTKSVADSKNFIQILKQLGNQDSELLKVDVSNKELYNSYASWVKAYEYMADKIIKDPTMYCDPASYIQQTPNWVASPLYVAGKFPAQNQLIKDEWQTVWGIAEKDMIDQGILDAELIQQKKLTSGKIIFSLDEANLLSQHIWMIYTLWSKSMLRPVHRSIACEVLKTYKPEWEILLL